jgi:hypothetical protein
MIEGPDPTYFMEYDGTPEELTKLMKMADDEEDLIQDWLELPVPRRKVLWSRLQAFLEKPPTDTPPKPKYSRCFKSSAAAWSSRSRRVPEHG